MTRRLRYLRQREPILGWHLSFFGSSTGYRNKPDVHPSDLQTPVEAFRPPRTQVYFKHINGNFQNLSRLDSWQKSRVSSILKVARGVDSPKRVWWSRQHSCSGGNSAHQENIETLCQNNLHENVSYFDARFFNWKSYEWAYEEEKEYVE